MNIGPVVRRIAVILAAFAALAAAAAVGDGWGEAAAMAGWRQRASHLAELYAAGLESALARYDYIPRTLALHPSVLALFRNPADAAQATAANRYLDLLNAETGAGDLYLVDLSGRVLASSNWREAFSFVGMDLSYRPYVQDALQAGQGRFYGIGTTNGLPGYYFAVAVRDGDRAIGVAVAKVSLEHIERSWLPGDERIFVTDAQGVIVLTSAPSWKFRVTAALSEPVRTAITQSRQYASVDLKPLSINERGGVDEQTRVVSLDGEGEPRAEYLAHVRSLAGTGWRMTVLSPIARFRDAGREGALIGGLTGGIVLLLLLYAGQRRLAFRQQAQAKAALQQANDALEERVAGRTAALLAAQAELIQKEKLAVLGRMAVGIVHELNQPLAAMRMMTDNARAFLRRNAPEDALDTLGASSRLIERMGRITGPLRAFARSSTKPVPCVIRVCVANALMVLDDRIRRDGALVDRADLPDDATALGDPDRLEQVLLNLFANALDAMAGQPAPRLTISAACVGGARIVVEVRDNGPGVPPEIAARLFEPFFTTKPVGQGLGLGLVISAAIVGEFGGALRHVPDVGGRFLLELQAAPACPAPTPAEEEKEAECRSP